MHLLMEGLAHVGVTPSDSLELRHRKVTLTLAASSVVSLVIIWVGTLRSGSGRVA